MENPGLRILFDSMIETNAMIREVEELEELTQFCVRPESKPCFNNWRDGLIRDYIRFMQNKGEIITRRDWTGAVCGIALGRQFNLGEDAVFNWQPTNPDGNAFVIYQVITSQPGILANMAKEMLRRFDGLDRGNFFTWRRHRLIQYKPEFWTRLERMTVYG